MHLLDLIFPKRCVGCGRVGRYFCSACQSKVQRLEFQKCPVCGQAAIEGWTHPSCRSRFTPDGLTSFFRYNGPIKNAVKSIKYRLVTDLASESIDLILFSALYSLDRVWQGREIVLIPVPLHPSRQRERGFNQAEVLGRAFAARLGINVNSSILVRIKRTAPQATSVSREARVRNMGRAFRVALPLTNQLKQTVLVVFDDVFTTGATLRSAMSVLKRAGAGFVWGVTLAQ